MRFPVTAICVAALFATVAPGQARSSERLRAEDYINLLRIDLRAAKAKLVVEALELTVDEASVFLPIYRQYDEVLSKLNTDRINQLRVFTENYAGIDDVRARSITQETFEFLHRRLELLEKYTRKVAKATSPRVAARFAQIENQLLMLIDVQLASDIPLVPRYPVRDNNG
ncbi:MAG TPA: hypothetical protein VGA56_05195 [Opitutaceae bacterium]